MAEPVFQLVAQQDQLLAGPSGVPYTEAPTFLAEDGDGFLWVGTEVGLERWDGYHFLTYISDNRRPCALPEGDVLTLHTDPMGRLWIGTLGGGLARYDRETDCFRVIAAGSTGLSSPNVNAVIDDGAGGLWIGTAAGLDHLDSDLSHVTHVAPDASGDSRLLAHGVQALLRDRDGALWVSTAEGLLRRSPAGADSARVPLAAASGQAPGAHPLSLFQSSDGHIWIGTDKDGVYVIDTKTLSARPVLDTNDRKGIGAIVAAEETLAGEIWFATQGSGILSVNPRTLQWRTIRHRAGVPISLLDDTVQSIHRDRSGRVWVASLRGIGYFPDQKAITTILSADAVRDAPPSAVMSMATMANDRVALGTQRGDVVVIDPSGSRVDTVSLGPFASIRNGAFALATSDGHDLFASIRPIGLLWIDARARGPALVPLPGPKRIEPVYVLQADRQRLWVGGQDGVWVLARGPSATASSPNPWEVVDRLELQNVRAISPPLGGTVWLGTVSGLFRFEPRSRVVSRIHLASTAHGASADPYVNSLLCDRRGRLWVGTKSQGIFVVDPSAIHADSVVPEAQIDEDLPNRTVDTLLEDASGNVWASTDRGIARIDPTHFSVRTFGRGDGLAISGYWLGSRATTPHGELLFGGTEGVTVIRPDRVNALTYNPPIVITSITVGHRTIPSSLYNGSGAGAVLRIPPEAKSFSVEFAALDYSEPERNAYAYLLEGYDRTWMRAIRNNRIAAYTNLPPGEYRLRLRATNQAGILVLSDKVLPISVAAAWYQTMWFHLAEALTAIALVAMIVRGRTVVLRARQRELQALVDRRTAELTRATDERRALIGSVAHDLRTPLTSLRGYLETLRLKDSSLAAEERQKFLGIAFRQSERLTRLIRELFDLVRLEETRVALSREQFHPADLVQDVVQEFGPIAESKKIAFEAGADTASLLMVGDIDLIQRMIDNLLDNAVRHTPAGGVITVKLAADEGQLQLDISDTGKGIAPADVGQIFDRHKASATSSDAGYEHAGLGLAIVNRIVELHGGTITVESAVGVGTHFSVRLPLAGNATAP